MYLPSLAFTFRAAGLTAILSLAAVSEAPCQFQFGFTAGVNQPTGDRMIREFGGVNGLPVSYPVLERWRVGSFAFVGRVARWTPSRIGIEATLGASPGFMNTRDSTNRVRETGSNTLMASLRMPVRITQRTSSILAHLSVGLGYIRYTGQSWTGYEGLGHPAGIVAFGGRGRLGRRSRFWFRFEFEDWMSRASFRQAGVAYDPQFYHQMIYGMGVIYQLGSRR